MTLEPRDVEAIADALAPRVAELLRADDPPFPSRGLVDVVQVCAFLGVEREWVYEHKAELGAVRIGRGRGVLRFEAAQVVAYVRRRRLAPHEEEASRARPGPRRRAGHVELLPLPGGVR